MMRAIPKYALAGALGLALLAPQPLRAQATIYPNAGQSPAQLDQDRAACESQAAAQSGYHPSQPTASPAPTRPMAGQRLVGAARGAAAGAVVKGVTDEDDREIEDPTKASARAGAVVGASRQRQDRREYRRETRQQQATQSQQQAVFDQSFGACMSSKGYTVQ
jgi:hypothetical protein